MSIEPVVTSLNSPPPAQEVVARPQRRKFSASEKRRILQAADHCTEPGQVGALLRREGSYSSHLTKWRKERQAGQLQALAGRKRGRSLSDAPRLQENKQLPAEVTLLKQQLEHAETIIEIQKKLLHYLAGRRQRRAPTPNRARSRAAARHWK